MFDNIHTTKYVSSQNSFHPRCPYYCILTSTDKTKVANSMLPLVSTYRQNAQKRRGMNWRTHFDKAYRVTRPLPLPLPNSQVFFLHPSLNTHVLQICDRCDLHNSKMQMSLCTMCSGPLRGKLLCASMFSRPYWPQSPSMLDSPSIWDKDAKHSKDNKILWTPNFAPPPLRMYYVFLAENDI